MGVDVMNGRFKVERYGPKRSDEDDDDYSNSYRMYDIAEPESLDTIVKEIHCNMYFFQDMADQGIKHAKTFLGPLPRIRKPLEEE